MKPSAHLASSVATGGIFYAATGQAGPAAVLAAVGTLLDLDHLVDLAMYQRHRAPGEGVLEVFEKDLWVKNVLFLHDWELLLPLGWAIARASDPVWWWAAATGFVLHLALDQLGNDCFAPTYFLTFRAWAGWDARRFWRKAARRPPR